MLDQDYGISRGMLRRCSDIGYSMLGQDYGISRGDVTTVFRYRVQYARPRLRC